MSKVADEYEEIARRLKELEADKQLALTGSSAPFIGVPSGGSSGTVTLSADQLPPYTPYDYDPA